MNLKRCSICRKEKNLDEFAKSKKSYYCKPCQRLYTANWHVKNKERRNAKSRDYYKNNKESFLERIRVRHRSFEGCQKEMYANMGKRIKNSKTYRGRKLLFSQAEFFDFINRNIETYRKLHSVWVANEYRKKFSPSVDRINNDGDYSLDNIQLITHGDNSRKKYKIDYAK